MLSHEIAPARAGHGRIVAKNVGGETVLAVARASSPLRFVRTTGGVCLVTFGAGLKDGDAVEVDIDVEDGATLVVFTQAATKVFRGRSSQALRANVHGRGTLIALPDPVAPFKGAEYNQRVEVDLFGPHARCVLLDGVTSGRPAYGERWAFERVDLRTTVRRDDRTLLYDALRLDARDGSIARRMAPWGALLTLAAIGVDMAADDEVGDDVVVAASPRVVRVAARSPERALAAARARLRNIPEIGFVDPFASRA